MMKKVHIIIVMTSLLFAACGPRCNSDGKIFESDNSKVNEAWELAYRTVLYNVRDSILAAGADYGGEWTRDVAINTWNGADFFIPEVVERSLWHVTNNRQTIGHQYWDKIIWVQGALYHFLLTRDTVFLREAYTCGANTIRQLEEEAYDKEYGLFTGSSVFNDGVSAFEEPIYDVGKPNSSSVLAHNTHGIKCLSTNCAYYMAYRALNEMHKVQTGSENPEFVEKARTLRNNIRRNFYNPRGQLFYVIDEQGHIHKHQEALGIAFAILSGAITPQEGHFTVIRNETTKYGIPSISPTFKRFSKEYPGRHNRLIWPFVNAFYANAALETGDWKIFEHEFYSMADLALDEDKGDYNFYEIFDPETGKPEGGHQSGKAQWHSRRHQTWSATGYMSMIHYGICGIRPQLQGLSFEPYLPQGINRLSIHGLKYGKMLLDIDLKGQGYQIVDLRINGKRSDSHFIPANLTGRQHVEIRLERPKFP
ncbi:MGH1-like glycoside hydrolase domain-containing protein [uncultured Alistipes sp.]|uniref:MGH1-like glycoside hydrolase domain-containing protein n=1 Tax=uncultured Alistipes sp. TaxID=538949 RepID=UPI003208E19B